ncbi:MAG: phosphotransferase [Anaerolineales bacterium]
MIPDAKQPAVTRALHTAFGVNEYEGIHLLTGGLSTALAFKIVVRNNPYLLKILRAEVISDPANEFACMQTAAEAGIAPRVWYANVEDRLLITDFVEARPFPDDMALRMAAAIRALHALPHFSMPKMGNYFDVMDKFFVRRFQAAKLLPDSATGAVFRGYDEMVKVYPRNDSELVASHNDLKPQNLRFDGERIWLVDWESAFLNDEYVDLAIAANFFVKDEAHEEAYLRAYFGEPASEYRRSRFYLMRQALSMFYATLLLLEASRAGLSIAADMPTPDFREFHQDLIADKVDMMTAEAKLQYGMIHLREALRNMRTPRFEEAVARVGDFHAGA